MTRRATGAVLMAGLDITLPEAPASALVTYRRAK